MWTTEEIDSFVRSLFAMWERDGDDASETMSKDEFDEQVFHSWTEQMPSDEEKAAIYRRYVELAEAN